jgi:hypothetical protein
MTALRGTRPFRALAMLWLVAIGAGIVDRLGITLIPIALFVTALVALTRLGPLPAAGLIVGAVLAVVIAIGTVPAIRDQVQFSLRSATGAPVLGDVEYLKRFSRFLFTSWWYSLGWVRYQAPLWWVSVTALIAIAASLGVVRQFLRSRALRGIIGAAALNLIALLAALCVVFLRLRTGPQGRYLFPAIVPLLILLWLGIEAWFPERLRKVAAIALVTAFALLDLSAWMFIAAPVYL